MVVAGVATGGSIRSTAAAAAHRGGIRLLFGGLERHSLMSTFATGGAFRAPRRASFLGSSLWDSSNDSPPSHRHPGQFLRCAGPLSVSGGFLDSLWPSGQPSPGARGYAKRAKRTKPAAVAGDVPPIDPDTVEDVELSVEARTSYLSYAMSVIVGRALPDARDGLKPVHRRILYAMHELGLAPNKPFRKSARVVGEVLGKYHPHGDTAVYDSLVRMAQDFSLGEPLVDGHGNFGSVDNDPAAAMRYTECKLQKLAVDMLLSDIAFDTVEYADNFDASCQEPVVLPSRLPNILLNGASGIAVGMATNMPPHNLEEVVDAVIHLIHNPECTVKDLMKIIKGPDFPTGALLLDAKDMRSAYMDGQGSCTLRARAEIEPRPGKKGRFDIVVTELPYQVNKATLVEQIANMADNKKIDGISDVRDESDRDGMRMVVEVKSSGDPARVLNALYKNTRMQIKWNSNHTVLVGSQPQRLSLLQLLQQFLDFRCDVIERRARFNLNKAESRNHLVEGLLLAIGQMDGVVTAIRASKDGAAAMKVLQRDFGLSEIQAEGVLSMALRRLTSLEAGKLESEAKELRAEITDLQGLLADKGRVLGVVEEEAMVLRGKYGRPRRTEIVGGESGAIDIEEMTENRDIILVMSEKGFIKRMPVDSFSSQQRGGKGVAGGKKEEKMDKIIACRDHDTILFFSESGSAYSLKAYDIPEPGARVAQGRPIIQLIPAMKHGEKITAVMPVSSFSPGEGGEEGGAAEEEPSIVFQTVKGMAKRVKLSAFSSVRGSGLIAMGLAEDDKLQWVRQCREGDDIFVATRRGNMLRYNSQDLRIMGRTARGVKAIKWKAEGDVVVGMEVVEGQADGEEGAEGAEEECKTGEGPYLVIITRKGLGKKTMTNKFRTAKRAGMGVTGITLNQGDDVAAMALAPAPAAGMDVIVGTMQGNIMRNPLKAIKTINGRATRGTKVMRCNEGDQVMSLSVVASAEIGA